MGLGGERDLRMYEPARFRPSTSYGYFWDVEELRHQEHLRRVSHAQYLYRHRHDSDEAAGLYRNFMEEQNEWMDEQERIKEMELRLSVKAYQQRASRWEEEWRKLEEGRNVEDILRQKKRAVLLITAPSQRELTDISGEENSKIEFSDFVMSSPSISSLDLTSPLLSFVKPSSQLVWPRNKTKHVDGNQQSRYTPPGKPNLLRGPTRSSATQSPSPSLGSSHSSSSQSILRSHMKQERIRKSSLVDGEVIRIITHKAWGKTRFLYLISWKLENSAMPPVEFWFGVIDFLEYSKKVILEDYHRSHNLGAVRWPRGSRKQPRTSTGFAVREIKSALDERKNTLLERGLSELQASRELNQERWKIRDDWQRLGRGWGSAIMIVEDRKKAWKIADSAIIERQLILTSKDKDASERSSGISSPDHIAMTKAVGIIDSDDTRPSLGLNTLRLNSLRDNILFQPENLNESSRSLLYDTSDSGGYDSHKSLRENQRNGFKGTSEDEREWREHFIPEPEISSSTELSRSCMRSRISRVRSTIHNIPNSLNLDLRHAKTLPVTGQSVAHPQASLQRISQEPAQVGYTSPVPTLSSISDAQIYLKAQRKKLLSRILSRESFKRGHHSLQAKPGEGVREPLTFIETASGPFRPPKAPPESLPNRSAVSSLSSYISFDGPSSEIKTQSRKNWAKAIWNKLAYLLVSPRQIHSRCRKEQPNKDLSIPPKNIPITHSVLECKNPPRPLLSEAAAIRTASWAASTLTPLKKSRSEEPRKVELVPSIIGTQEVATEIIFTHPRTNAEEITNTRQLSLEVYNSKNSLSDHIDYSSKLWRVDKGKGKAKVDIDYSPKSTQTAPPTRKLSKEEYLAKREAEKQAQRDKAVLRTKINVKKWKEKADEYADDLKRLENLCWKKACPLSKWKRSNQLELDLLRMKLRTGLDKRTPGRVVIADLQKLRSSLQPAAVSTKTQSKGCSQL